MEENLGNTNNNNRNYGMNRPRGGGSSRFRHGGGGGGNRPSHFQGRGRPQRPLLTSAINGTGLSLIALLLVGVEKYSLMHTLLAIAVIVFGISSLVSYVAQRFRPAIFEKISDLFFIAGAGILIAIGVMVGGFF